MGTKSRKLKTAAHLLTHPRTTVNNFASFFPRHLFLFLYALYVRATNKSVDNTIEQKWTTFLFKEPIIVSLVNFFLGIPNLCLELLQHMLIWT